MIYFPTHSSLTSLLVFAAGAALGAGAALHTETLTGNCVPSMPSTRCSGVSGCPEHPSPGMNHFLAKSPSGHAAGARYASGWAATGQGFPLVLFSSAHLTSELGLSDPSSRVSRW